MSILDQWSRAKELLELAVKEERKAWGLLVLERSEGKDLTFREQEVLERVRLGKANKQIADELCISTGTVKFHLRSLLKKFDVDCRRDL